MGDAQSGSPRPKAGSAVGGKTPAAKLAAGYQPAVLKVVSYGHGVQRATAIGKYVQRDEAALETHEGKILATHDAVSAEMESWARDFDKRRPSDDVATFQLSLAGEGSADRLREAVEAGFAGHRFAYRIDELADGSREARVVATMAGHSVVRGENGDEKVRERFHVSESRRGGGLQFSAPTRRLIADRIAGRLDVEADAVTLTPAGEASHGKAGVVYQLSRLASRGQAITERGEPIMTEPQVRATAQAWNRSLNSFEPRDVMHMILSAKAGEDKDALVKAARGFLHAQFPDHKFAFALHDDKEQDGHMHVHAIVAVKGEGGERLRPGPADLRAWRAVYAEKAEAEGMKIVATSAAYRASSQSYGSRDKAIVDVAENPREGREARDRAYAKANPHVVDNARRRIERAQTNPVLIPETKRQLQAVGEALEDWRIVSSKQTSHSIGQHFVDRLTQASVAGRVIVALNQYKKMSAMTENKAVAGTGGAREGETHAHIARQLAETRADDVEYELSPAEQREVDAVLHRAHLDRLAREAIPAVQQEVASRVAAQTADLNDPNSASYIAENNEVMRAYTGSELAFLTHMANGLAKLKPGGILDFSRTETQATRDDNAFAALELKEDEHLTHLSSVADLRQTLQEVGIAVDTRFRVTTSEDQKMAQEATAAEMRENMKEINEAVAVAAAVLEGGTRAEFLRRTAETMEVLAIRTDAKANQERGKDVYTEDEVRQLAGPHADAIIAHARQIQAAERREADRAEQIADRAVEQQARDTRSGSADPASLERVTEDRAMVRNAETIAAQERQEADAAAQAARALAENPGWRLDPNIVQGDRLEELNREQQRLENEKGINISPVQGADAEAEKPASQKM